MAKGYFQSVRKLFKSGVCRPGPGEEVTIVGGEGEGEAKIPEPLWLPRGKWARQLEELFCQSSQVNWSASTAVEFLPASQGKCSISPARGKCSVNQARRNILSAKHGGNELSAHLGGNVLSTQPGEIFSAQPGGKCSISLARGEMFVQPSRGECSVSLARGNCFRRPVEKFLPSPFGYFFWGSRKNCARCTRGFLVGI
jgi:hypothetical protein